MIDFPNSRSERPVAVLLIDPHEWSARALGSVLKGEGYDVTRVDTAREALEYVDSASPDVVFVESHLKEYSGRELCAALRAHANVGPATPIILTTTSPILREERLAALRAGAWDIVAMPADASELLLRLNVFIQARAEVVQARERSMLDASTDLYSTHGLRRRLRELSVDALRHHSPVACVVIAPDAESVGSEAASPEPVAHAVGRLEHLMLDATRASDAVGKVGPAEYAIVAPRTDSAAAFQLAQRLYRAAHDQPGQPDRPLRLRMGCYALENFDEVAVRPDDILARATAALRKAQIPAAVSPICMFDHPGV